MQLVFTRVLIVEAGEEHFLNPFISIPALTAFSQMTSVNWGYKTASQKNACKAMQDQVSFYSAIQQAEVDSESSHFLQCQKRSKLCRVRCGFNTRKATGPAVKSSAARAVSTSSSTRVATARTLTSGRRLALKGGVSTTFCPTL